MGTCNWCHEPTMGRQSKNPCVQCREELGWPKPKRVSKKLDAKVRALGEKMLPGIEREIVARCLAGDILGVMPDDRPLEIRLAERRSYVLADEVSEKKEKTCTSGVRE